MTTTTTTTTKQAVSPSAPTPAPSLQEDSTTNDRNVEPALEKAKSEIDALEKVELDSDEPVAATPDHDHNSIPILNPPDDFDFLNGLMTGQENQLRRRPLTPINAALLEQNSFLIQQLAEQNKALLAWILPSHVSCGTCGAESQKSGGSKPKKKKEKEKESKSSFANVHIVLRVLSLVLLAVIAVQLGLIRGEGSGGKNGRRAGFFGR